MLLLYFFQASIFSVFLATWSITTLLVGPLVKLRSERFVAILGNSVLIAGFILAAFATNTLHLVISIGILIGPSFGLINVNVLLIINTWFEKKAGLAISVMLTFNCLGKMAVPQLVKILMLKFTVEQVLFYASDIFSLSCHYFHCKVLYFSPHLEIPVSIPNPITTTYKFMVLHPYMTSYLNKAKRL